VTDDVSHHMTPKGQTRDPNTLKPQYRENSNFATIVNYYTYQIKSNCIVKNSET